MSLEKRYFSYCTLLLLFILGERRPTCLSHSHSLHLIKSFLRREFFAQVITSDITPTYQYDVFILVFIHGFIGLINVIGFNIVDI